MIAKVKSILKRHSAIINFFPFINKFNISGTTVDAKGIMIHCRVKCSGKGNTIKLCRGSVLRNCDITIVGNNNSLLIDSRVDMTNGRIVICDSNNLVTIGANTHFNTNVVLDCMEGRKLTIGENCLFSADITVRTGDWHSIYDMDGFRINHSKDVAISRNCWIGDRVSILKGSFLPEGTIVGTGSVVTKNIGEVNSIIAGVPARILRTNVQWDRTRGDLRREDKDDLRIL